MLFPRWTRAQHRGSVHQVAGAIIQQTVVFDCAGIAIKPNAKMLTAEVYARIGEGMAECGCDRTAGNRCVSRPDSIGVNGSIAHETIGMARHGGSVLPDTGRAV